MGNKTKSHKKTEKATAKRVKLSQVNQQNDESDGNESSNQEETSIIHNLPISAAPAADLLQSTNTINNSLSIQLHNLLLQSNLNAVNVLGLVSQAQLPDYQVHSSNNPNDMV